MPYKIVKLRQEPISPLEKVGRFLIGAPDEDKTEGKPLKKDAEQAKPGPDKVPTPKNEGMIPDWMQHVAATTTRVAAPWLGSVGGGIAGTLVEPGGGTAIGAAGGGAAGGAAGEYLAQLMEPGGLHHDANLKRVGVSAALGAVPGSAMMKAGAPLTSAAMGAGFGYLGNAAYKSASGEPFNKAVDPREWSLSDIMMGPVLGGAVGAGLGAITKAPPTAAPAAPPVEIQTTAQPGGITFTKRGVIPVEKIRAIPMDPNGKIDIELPRPEQDVAGAVPLTGTPAEASGRVQKIVAKENAEKAKLQDQFDTASTKKDERLFFEQQKAAEAAEKQRMADAAQEAKNRDAAIAHQKEVSLAHDAAKAEDAKRVAAEIAQADAERQANAIEDLKGTLTEEVPPSSISEGVSGPKGGGAHGGTERATFRRTAPDPVEGEEGGIGGEGGGPKTPPTPEQVAHTPYKSALEAFNEGSKHGPGTVHRAAKGEFYYKFDKPKTEPPAAGTPPPEAPPAPEGGVPAPTGPKPEPPAPTGEGAPPALDRESLHGQPMTKPRAELLAKELGGRVHQYGPRKFTVLFDDIQAARDAAKKAATDAAVERAFPPEGSAPATPPEKFKPSTPIVPEPPVVDSSAAMRGNLTPEEFHRYMQVIPVRGVKRTAAEMAEYSALHTKMKAPPTEPFVAPTGEKEPVLPGVEPTINPGAPGVASVPFPASKIKGKAPKAAAPETPDMFGGTKSAKVKESENPMMDSLMNDLHGEEDSLPPINPEGHGTLPAEPPTPAAEPSTPAVEVGPTYELDRLKEAYRTTTSETHKRWLAEQIGEVEASLKESGVETPRGQKRSAIPVAPQKGKGVPEAPVVPTEAAPAAGKVETEAAAAANAKEPLPPQETTPDWVTEQLKEVENAAKKKGGGTVSLSMGGLAGQFAQMAEIGRKYPTFVARLGLGTAGAIAGAALHPDDPITGALVGASAGAFAPTVGRMLVNRISSGQTSPATTMEALDKIKDITTTFVHMIPEWNRFSLLLHPKNLPLNMWVGPWGSAIMASMEHALSGDRRGIDSLKLLLNPKNFPLEWHNARANAAELLANSNERTEGMMGSSGPKWFQDVTSMPGTYMTAGDLAARNILKRAGFTEEEARLVTLTSEPYTAFGRGLGALKKGARREGEKASSWLINMMLPFYRTSTNQLEQGMERAPFIGLLWKRNADSAPIELRQKLVQQGIGMGVSGIGYTLGYLTPESNAKFTSKFISNFGGQYGNIASVAFALGQAKRNGSSKAAALLKGINEGLPMPSNDITEKLVNDYRALTEGDRELKQPFKMIPGVVDPNTPGSLPSLYDMATAKPQRPVLPVRQVPDRPSRYKSVRPRK